MKYFCVLYLFLNIFLISKAQGARPDFSDFIQTTIKSIENDFNAEFIPKLALQSEVNEVFPEFQNLLNRFESELVRLCNGKISVIARQELAGLIDEVNEFSFDEPDALEHLIKESKVDYLLFASYQDHKGGKTLQFKLVHVDTGQLLLSQLFDFENQIDQDLVRYPTFSSFEEALHNAVLRLHENHQPIFKDGLILKGVYEAESARQTNLSLYMADLLNEEIKKLGAVKSFQLSDRDFRGLKLKRKTQKNDAFIIARYWQLDQGVLVKLDLIDRSFRNWSWYAVVKSILSSEQRLIKTFKETAQADQPLVYKGTLGLRLLTNKGRHPLFFEGEEMILALSVDEDAYVSCYYQQASGELFKIFPNQYTPESFLKAGQVMYLPEEHNSYAFEFVAPFGTEIVQCFAFKTSKEYALEKEYKHRAFDVLDNMDFNRLSDFYRSGVEYFSQDRLVLSVYKKESLPSMKR